jgi:predicted nucleic acid-binding protein
LRLVLDADVVIGALDAADQHFKPARSLFTQWHEAGDERLISVVNLSEVLVAPSLDPKRLRIARSAIHALGITVHQPSELIGIETARLRGRHPISLPDAYCIATARHARCVLVSFDQKVLRAARTEGIEVHESARPGPDG